MAIAEFGTLFIIGAGANVNGWAPVVAAIREVEPTADVSTPDEANFYMAQHVYKRRFGEVARARGATNADQDCERLREADRHLKSRIVHHLNQARLGGSMRLRPRLLELMQEKGRTQPKGWVTISTNWDTLPETKGIKGILHVHGDVRNPGYLYLPTETTEEPYRTPEERAHLGKHTSAIWQLIAEAKDIVVYGFSFSALDAEFCFAMEVGLRDKPHRRHIHVVDCHDQVEKIAKRIRVLGGSGLDLDFHLEPVNCGGSGK